MTTDVYWIAADIPGKIGIMPRPRGGEQLSDEIKALSAANVHTIVSLLTPPELSELELHLEAEECANHHIEFIAFPIKDRQVPSLDYAVLSLFTNLSRQLSQGRNIVIHCRMGVGRAALVAACTLVLCGLHPDGAFATISKARGCPVPDTVEQKQWVSRFARTHQTLKPSTDLWLIEE